MTYFVDFSGYCEIEADSPEEAEDKFWGFINRDEPLPENIFDVEGIEEKRD